MIQLFDEAAPRRLSREDLTALALIAIEGARTAVIDGELTIASALIDDARVYLAQMTRQEPIDG